MSGPEAASEARDHAVAWHDVECGAFTADLETWASLARRAAGPVVELGAGTGRVSLDLAARGFEVTAVELDRRLAEEARRRARRRGLRVEVQVGDALKPSRGCCALALAPMQLAQDVGAAGLERLLGAMRSRLRPGGLAALAIVEDEALSGHEAGEESAEPPPDMREIGGWVYSSRPLWVSVDDDAITVTRVREAVSPDGALERSAHRDVLTRLTGAELESAAASHGLSPVERIRVPGSAEVDSTVVVLEAR